MILYRLLYFFSGTLMMHYIKINYFMVSLFFRYFLQNFYILIYSCKSSIHLFRTIEGYEKHIRGYISHHLCKLALFCWIKFVVCKSYFSKNESNVLSNTDTAKKTTQYNSRNLILKLNL